MTDKKRRMELHPSGAPSSEAGGSTVSMEEPVNQRGAHNHWTEGASSEETLTLKQEEEEEECEDIKPTFLPKVGPKQYQDKGGGGQEGQNGLVVIKTEQSRPEESSSFVHGGENQHVLHQSKNVSSPSCEPPSTSKEAWVNQHTLKEDICNSLVIIKMEPDERELNSSGRHCVLYEPEGVSNLLTLCKTEDLNTSGISGYNVPTLIPKTEPPPTSVEHVEDDGGDEFESKNQHTLKEDVHSSLDITIKMEPDEQELISSGEHHILHELEEVSNLPPVCKTEPNTLGMPYSAYIDEEPWHEYSGKEENGGFNTSGECNQPSGEEHKGLKSYPCSECGRTFSQSSSFYRHMRIHTGERPFQCSQCNKTFIQSNTFKIHQRIHTGEKPYKCSDCGKNFRRLDNLRIHQRAHTGEKPYKCSHCPKTFTRLDILQNHERIHTGEKPYQCSHCSKTFTRSSVYQVHQRTHTGERPYKCSICGRQFLDLSNLRNHERTHTKKRPHHCSV
ncbi:hypothetical protein SRHO_G00177980 [Serrasalmus rhombeus]